MTIDSAKYIGRTPEELSIDERHAVAGQWAALELYTPQTLPQRIIAALGPTVAECIRQLKARDLDPQRFEYIVITGPFA